MLIVSGQLRLHPGTRDRFLAKSRSAVILARQAPGCRDFVVAADPIDSDRVNIYEEWESEESLLAFRGDGPDNSTLAYIMRATVHRHLVASTDPA